MPAILPENNVPSLKHNKLFSYAAIFTMPIEGIFFFGLIIGWPNLAEILKAEGVYAEVCETGNSSTTNCPARDELFASVGTLGSVTMNFVVFPLGFIFDRYGSFITRLVYKIVYKTRLSTRATLTFCICSTIL